METSQPSKGYGTKRKFTYLGPGPTGTTLRSSAAGSKEGLEKLDSIMTPYNSSRFTIIYLLHKDTRFIYEKLRLMCSLPPRTEERLGKIIEETKKRHERVESLIQVGQEQRE